MKNKWKISEVRLLEGGLLYGFGLYDQNGRPSVSLGYATEAEASAGRKHVVAALKGVKEILAG